MVETRLRLGAERILHLLQYPGGLRHERIALRQVRFDLFAFAQRIAAEPAQPGEEAGDAYYRQWLAALEDMVAHKGAGTRDQLAALQRAWDRAADRTPHGQPIELRADDFEI